MQRIIYFKDLMLHLAQYFLLLYTFPPPICQLQYLAYQALSHMNTTILSVPPILPRRVFLALSKLPVASVSF